MTELTICKCGCDQEVPIRASNVWKLSDPYWAWMCHKTGCKWKEQEWRNQSGDATCSMCGSERELIGHFVAAGGSSNWNRRRVTGELLTRNQLARYFWKGRGFFTTEYREGNGIEAMRHNPAEGDGR